ncbi:MAG: hypothetical protein M1818_000648 [Claussenomyces sp. TS43310]|nr:MAG: hypothetical protein M1818_000648 [Claussenomyces sp. TS43310]
MTSILCLAHYCDTHGPTPLMVTEGLPVGCSTCFDEDMSTSDPRDLDARSPKSPGGFQPFSRSFTSTGSIISTSRDAEKQASVAASSSFALDTPPDSPRLAALQTTRNQSRHRRDSSFRKTYDENDKKRAIPCENCALTIPQKVKEQIPEGAPGSPTKIGQGFTGSPVLRTRKPYERISGNAFEERSLKSSSVFSDSDETVSTGRRGRDRLSRQATSSADSYCSSSSSDSHTHYLDYTSTHDPMSSTSFSILRASCLRTLSCETLPPSATSNAPPTPTSPYASSRSPPTSSAIPSGGPIFFGDPLAGYTTAYIFRVPDPYARGRRRIYAFICLSTARERAAMQTFSYLAAAFRDLASWIQNLAETEAEKIDNDAADAESPSGKRASQSEPKRTPTSSFLSGRPCDPDGYPRKGLLSLPRSRGLAELVGRADFFIELHARFVALLAQLSAMFAA